MGPKRFSRSELIRFFDSQPPPAVEAADIIPIKKTRLAFLTKEGAPRPRTPLRIADYIDRRLLSGIATSSDSEELSPMDDDLFDLVTYAPAYDYFVSLLQKPDNEWIDAALFEASSSSSAAVIDYLRKAQESQNEDVTDPVDDLAASAPPNEDRPIYRASFSYSDFEMELLQAIRFRSNKEQPGEREVMTMSLGQNLASKGYAISSMFDLNKFMTQRAAEHWVMQQGVRRSLGPLFDVQDEE